MLSENLCWLLLNNNEHDLIVRYRRELEWAAQTLHILDVSGAGDEPCGLVLALILSYDKANGYCPDEQVLCDYVTLRKKDITTAEKLKHFGDELERMRTYMRENEGIKDPETQTNVLFEATGPLIEKLVEDTRLAIHTKKADVYKAFALGQTKITGKKGTPDRKSTPDDAVQMIREFWSKGDLQKTRLTPEGALHENTEAVKLEVERWMSGDGSDRILTGFPHVDNHIVITKNLNQFIGIMGFANDGKSTLLLTMLYNMACQGKNVILWVKETEPMNVWIHLAFLHSYRYRDEFELPAMDTFFKRTASKEDFANLQRILDDIKSRVGIPGLFEVKRLSDWDTLIAHLNANQKKNQYDVCGIDYLTRLEIPGDPAWFDKNIIGYIHKAFDLSRNFDEGRGLVVITPVQINRTGYKEAKKKKEGEKKHDMTSINQHSDFFRDMDFIVSIFSDEIMKRAGDLLVETQKVRNGAYPPSARVRIDENSRYVGASAAQIDARIQSMIDRKTLSDVTKWKETIIDSVDDSLGLDSDPEMGGV
jgi:hypothetical protein